MAEYKILKTWELETTINHLLHQHAASHYNQLNALFMLPIIMSSTAIGTIGFISSRTPGFNILIGSFGYISAILTAIHNYLNIQKLHATHSLHAVEYSKIARDIKMHIYLSHTDVKVYANIAEYIKQCRTKIDKLNESSDDVPDHIEKKLQGRIQDIRREETNEINELIQLSMDKKACSVNIDDLTDLSDILVVKERRKSKDGEWNSGRTSPDSARISSDSMEAAKSSSSDNSESDIQEQLSLNTFLRSVEYKNERASWKRNLRLVDAKDCDANECN